MLNKTRMMSRCVMLIMVLIIRISIVSSMDEMGGEEDAGGADCEVRNDG